MAIIRVRGLSEKGIIKDVEPFDLPTNCFSGGSNVRFSDGKAMRSPAFRLITNGGFGANVTNIVGYRPASGQDRIFAFLESGDVRELNGPPSYTPVNVNPTGFTEVTSDQQWTFGLLGDVLYAGRETHVPMYFGPTSTTWEYIPNWNANDRARIIRTFGDYVLALGMIKNGIEYPTMVKWSDLTLYGQPPGTWDHTVATNSAGENILTDLDSPIIEGAPLRDMFVIYGERQVVAMERTSDFFVFRFRRLFNDGGALNCNCVVEVDGKHYVFGTSDIYVHDGVQKRSIAEGRVRQFIFKNMNFNARRVAFVQHNPNTREIMFCYQSGDGEVAFTTGMGVTRCNKAAVYNYVNDTWSFMDLPNVSGMTVVNIAAAETTYDSATATYDTAGGKYIDLEDNRKNHVIAVGRPIPGVFALQRVWGLDGIDDSILPFQIDTQVLTPAWLVRTGIDLDEEGAPIPAFKTIKRLYPQISMTRDAACLINGGISEFSGVEPVWLQPTSYNPRQDYKIDTRMAGRYLAISFRMEGTADFRVSGFDADVVLNGRR